MPFVSIIILNYNGLKFVDSCLNSVFDTVYPNFEVVFVDNASTDGSFEYVQEKFGDRRLKIIRNEKNLGFAEGNNVGAKIARGEYIVFLNQDTEVNPNWLREFVEVMEADHSIGACQSKLLLLDNREWLDGAGDFITFYGGGYPRGFMEKDLGQYDRVEEIFSARGAALMVRREVLDTVGLFDPMFFAVYEDVDLGWRIRLNGHRIVLVPKSVVFHQGISSVGKASPQIVFHRTKNKIMLLIKNYNRLNLLRNLPTLIVLELLMAVFSVLKTVRDFCGGGLPKLKAFVWILSNLKYIWRERLVVQHFIRRVPDSVVTQHMLKANLFVLALRWFILHRHEYGLWDFLTSMSLHSLSE